MAEAGGPYRLVTRSDFDGLVCAVLLKDKGVINDILFVHPKDMQDGKVAITDRDITTNLPYVPGCHMAFDHHSSETTRAGGKPAANQVIDPDAPSAARVVYSHYGGAKTFPRVSKEMMDEVDKADSAQYTKEEILNPGAWVLLNYIMDPRTGLGRFRTFRISNYQLMMELIDYCRAHTIQEILRLPDVLERVELYNDQAERHRDQLRRCTKVHKNLVVLDLRNEETIYAGNRFMIYAMFLECNVSIHVMWGLKKMNTVFAVGKSIVDRSSKTDVGELCLKYGGGGHRNAGTCQVENDSAEKVLGWLVQKITKDG